ncbi:MAG: hypothetical protein ABI234_11155 [Ktedonobacteraceae bacterium]
MPVVEFALDSHAQQRIQVHIPIEPTAVTVMLNRSVLGFLATSAEQKTGKYFVLPDRSQLYVRFEGQRVQAFRNNRLLAPLDAEEAAFDGTPAAKARAQDKKGVGLLARLIKGPNRE